MDGHWSSGRLPTVFILPSAQVIPVTPETVINIGQGALFHLSIILLFLLVPALVVGVLVSMFQAATQINEMTLSFIPKLLTTLLVMALAGPWILRLITEYTLRLFEEIPALLG